MRESLRRLGVCAGCAGDEDGLDHSTWFQRCVSLPRYSRWRLQCVCMRVCVLTEQVGELLCHLEMPGAAQMTKEA